MYSDETSEGTFYKLLMIANAFPLTLAVGALVNFTIQTVNAVGPVTFSASGGLLGLGLSLNASTGVISGTALVGSLIGKVITATDSLGRTATLTINLTIS